MMKKILVMLAAAGLIGAAIAQQDDRKGEPMGSKPDRTTIDVTVVKGKIAVSEEEAATVDAEGALVWRMKTAGFSFPANGIVMDAQGNRRLRCRAVANGQRFRCAKVQHVKGERYKYDVNVVDATGKALPTLDPFITTR